MYIFLKTGPSIDSVGQGEGAERNENDQPVYLFSFFRACDELNTKSKDLVIILCIYIFGYVSFYRNSEFQFSQHISIQSFFIYFIYLHGRRPVRMVH